MKTVTYWANITRCLFLSNVNAIFKLSLELEIINIISVNLSISFFTGKNFIKIMVQWHLFYTYFTISLKIKENTVNLQLFCYLRCKKMSFSRKSSLWSFHRYFIFYYFHFYFIYVIASVTLTPPTLGITSRCKDWFVDTEVSFCAIFLICIIICKFCTSLFDI